MVSCRETFVHENYNSNGKSQGENAFFETTYFFVYKTALSSSYSIYQFFKTSKHTTSRDLE